MKKMLIGCFFILCANAVSAQVYESIDNLFDKYLNNTTTEQGRLDNCLNAVQFVDGVFPKVEYLERKRTIRGRCRVELRAINSVPTALMPCEYTKDIKNKGSMCKY